jgi:RNA-binding protein YlmH
MADSNKDKSIVTQAILKSLIESGVPQEQWGDMTKEGIRVYLKVLGEWVNS